VFVRQHGEALGGQWGMIPPGATNRVPRSKTTGRPLSTNNARRETVATDWTFRYPWARGQRCLAWWYQVTLLGHQPLGPHDPNTQKHPLALPSL
jgi:hypothetical protein